MTESTAFGITDTFTAFTPDLDNQNVDEIRVKVTVMVKVRADHDKLLNAKYPKLRET